MIGDTCPRRFSNIYDTVPGYRVLYIIFNPLRSAFSQSPSLVNNTFSVTARRRRRKFALPVSCRSFVRSADRLMLPASSQAELKSSYRGTVCVHAFSFHRGRKNQPAVSRAGKHCRRRVLCATTARRSKARILITKRRYLCIINGTKQLRNTRCITLPWSRGSTAEPKEPWLSISSRGVECRVDEEQEDLTCSCPETF